MMREHRFAGSLFVVEFLVSSSEYQVSRHLYLYPFVVTGVGKIVLGLKPVNTTIIRPINGTAMNKKQLVLSFIAVGFNQRNTNINYWL